MDNKMKADPNEVFRLLMQVFVAAGMDEVQAREAAGAFWKRIYVDSVMMLADETPEMDKDKLREIAGKGIMTELLVEALKYVPAEKIEDYVRKVARTYSRVLREELSKKMSEDKAKEIEGLWRKFGEEKGIIGNQEVNNYEDKKDGS